MVFHPVCHSAELRTSLSAATVSPAGRMGQRVDVLSGYRKRGEKKAEAAGWQDNWCAGRQSGHRVVHPAVLVRIQVRLVLVPILVWILVSIPVLIVLVRISGAPILLVWSEKKRAGVRKGVPWAEPSP
jgi:Flp pilus assembly protein TadB